MLASQQLHSYWGTELQVTVSRVAGYREIDSDICQLQILGGTFAKWEGLVTSYAVSSSKIPLRTRALTDTRLSKIYPLAHIIDTWALSSTSLPHFYSLPQQHHVTASHHSQGDNHQSTWGRSERTQSQAKMAAWNSFSYTCTS